MRRFHYDADTGKTGACEANVGVCPFNPAGDKHYDTEVEARGAYEATQTASLFSVARTQPKSLTEMAAEQASLLEDAKNYRTSISGIKMEARKEYVEKILGRLIESKKATEDRYAVKDHKGGILYEPKRSVMHDEIIDEILSESSRAGVKAEGKALFSGGLGGAGKTTVLKGYVNVNIDEYIMVNPDDIKEIMARKGMIPKVKGLTPMEASPLVHEESSYIATTLLSKAIENKENVIVDITMSSTGSVKRRIDKLKAGGYTSVTSVFVDITPETSKVRAALRYSHGMNSYTESGQGYGGRYLPDHITNANRTDDPLFNSRNAKNLVELHSMGMFTEEPLVFGNDGSAPVSVPFREFSSDLSDFIDEE